MPFQLDGRPKLLDCQDGASSVTIPGLSIPTCSTLHSMSSVYKNKKEEGGEGEPQREGAEGRAGSLSNAVETEGCGHTK